LVLDKVELQVPKEPKAFKVYKELKVLKVYLVI
jgi:hypothetical protein